MAISTEEVQIQWTGSVDSISVSSGSSQDSLEFTIPAGTFQLSIQCKADNNGTPASGDIVTFKLLPTLGDPDGSGSDEFDTPGAGKVIMALDTNSEDPVIHTVDILPNMKAAKLRAENGASSNAITVSATTRALKST